MKTGRTAASFALLFLLSAVGTAHAQWGSERFEVGANLSLMNVSDMGSTNAGVGGRVTFNLTRHIAVETDIEYFPDDRITTPETRIDGKPFALYYDRRRTTGLFGVKVGTRGSRFGVFGKASPGFTNLGLTGSGCLGEDCMNVLARTQMIAFNDYRTEFAFNVSGGVELFPTPGMVARVEVGDTYTRHTPVAPPCYVSACSSHNLSSRVGLGWRF